MGHKPSGRASNEARREVPNSPERRDTPLPDQPSAAIVRSPEIGWDDKLKEWFGPFPKYAAAILFICGVFYSAMKYIDRRVESALQDEAFLGRLRPKVRAWMVFDFGGTIQVNQGGLDYIEKIVPVATNRDPLSVQFTIVPRRFLNAPPVLSPVAPTLFDYQIKRGDNINWNLTILPLVGWNANSDIRIRLDVVY